LYESAKNPIIKLFIHNIILDTMRHSDTYQMLIDLNSSAAMGKESQEVGEKELASHIKEEAIMLKQAKDISEVVRDKKIKQLILNILEDERHHRSNRFTGILKKEAVGWDACNDLITGFPKPILQSSRLQVSCSFTLTIFVSSFVCIVQNQKFIGCRPRLES
jgi:rubrerythrin